jgi:2-hydroxy-3-keto-5-methylthiopentenyl-1-phosphate phosphatase
VPTPPLAVVCDFDGTATLLDIGDEISRHFGGAAHWEFERARFTRGELDTRGIIEAIYTRVFASEKEIRDFAVEAARLRPGFKELVAAAKERSAPFFLASGGLRQYIEAVLEAHLEPALRETIRIRANEAIFGTGALKVGFPGEAASRAAGCDACGSCKRVSIAEARALGAPYVIGLGDGFADRCLVQFADRTFAREGSYLHRYCVDRGLPHTTFNEMFDAANAVRTFRG